uniref:Uncharacterized protein n=1 Tax=Arundo donax TaxID=35708 RepID=A0A0A9BU38_ARUDO
MQYVCCPRNRTIHMYLPHTNSFLSRTLESGLFVLPKRYKLWKVNYSIYSTRSLKCKCKPKSWQ